MVVIGEIGVYGYCMGSWIDVCIDGVDYVFEGVVWLGYIGGIDFVINV